MKLTLSNSKRTPRPARACVLLLVFFTALLPGARAQAPTTTTVTGTVYLANGQPGSGTLVVSWPAFTTAAGQLVAADSTTVTIPSDGFVSVSLAPNLGATPAGEYYTAVFYMSDGSTSTEYWLVPAASSATLAAVQAQVMPAAQAVQTVSKAYVDEAIAELTGSEITASGGTLTGPLYLSGDPTAPLQAADKHYVDTEVAADLPLTGGTLSGPVTATQIGAAYQVDQFAGADFGAKLAACLAELARTVPAATRHNGTLEIWLPPVPGKQYLVSVDPAGGGVRGDYSAVEVLEMEKGLQCAEFAGHMGGLELARLARDLAIEYNHALLVVERNNHGAGVLAYLEESCTYERVYRQKGQPGWLTTSLSRPAAVGRLASALVDEPHRFQSRRLLGECRSFVRLANGNTGARPGAHDDRVLAMAIGLAARAEMVERGKR